MCDIAVDNAEHSAKFFKGLISWQSVAFNSSLHSIQKLRGLNTRRDRFPAEIDAAVSCASLVQVASTARKRYPRTGSFCFHGGGQAVSSCLRCSVESCTLAAAIASSIWSSRLTPTIGEVTDGCVSVQASAS